LSPFSLPLDFHFLKVYNKISFINNQKPYAFKIKTVIRLRQRFQTVAIKNAFPRHTGTKGTKSEEERENSHCGFFRTPLRNANF